MAWPEITARLSGPEYTCGTQARCSPSRSPARHARTPPPARPPPLACAPRSAPPRTAPPLPAWWWKVENPYLWPQPAALWAACAVGGIRQALGALSSNSGDGTFNQLARRAFAQRFSSASRSCRHAANAALSAARSAAATRATAPRTAAAAASVAAVSACRAACTAPRRARAAAAPKHPSGSAVASRSACCSAARTCRGRSGGDRTR